MVIHAKCYVMRVFSGVVLVILCGMLCLSSFAQTKGQELPLITAGKLPLYPIMARAARVQGIVKIKVTTDGKRVVSTDVESGPPMLVKFVKENIISWGFAEHKPATFVTTFEYVIDEPAQCDYGNAALTLNLPLEARISVKGLKTCDPAAAAKPHP